MVMNNMYEKIISVLLLLLLAGTLLYLLLTRVIPTLLGRNQ